MFCKVLPEGLPKSVANACARKYAATATVRRRRARWLVCCIVAGWLASACGGSRVRADAIAAAAQFDRATVQGTQFAHLIYSAAAGDSSAPLWVYIEGDGVPWIDQTIPSRDPTPRALVALAMMTRGPGPAVYLGRPCYFGTAERSPCEPVWWTHRRFGPEVVSSMVSALDRIVDQKSWNHRPINLVGFSGGGTLATLMAARTKNVCALITVASPLDIDEWAASHDYSPLAGSGNPAVLPALRGGIRQLHLRGGRDKLVSQDNGIEFRRRNPAARFRVVANVDHGYAWVDVWDELLRRKTEPAIADCL